MKAELLTIFCAVVFFLLSLTKKPRVGIGLLLFLIPTANIPFSWNNFDVSFLVFSILSFLCGYFLCHAKHLPRTLHRIPYKMWLFLLLLMLTISFCKLLLTGLDGAIETPEGNVVRSVTNFSSVLLSAYAIFILMNMRPSTRMDIIYYIKWFLSSIVFLTLMVSLINIGAPVPYFMRPMEVIGSGPHQESIFIEGFGFHMRGLFTGYLGFIENFSEYLFVIFGLSLILLCEAVSVYEKMYGLLCLCLSVLFSLFCGSKSFPFMAATMLIVPLFRFNLRNGLILCTLTIAAVTCIWWIGEPLPLIERLMILQQRYYFVERTVSADVLPYLIGRRDLLSYIPDAISAGGLFGVGPVVVHYLNGSWIPYHNLYYALYLSFGLVGFVVFVCFFSVVLYDLLVVIKRDTLSNFGNYLFAIFLILLVEQIKVSAFRVPSGVLIWWFLISLFALYITIVRSDSAMYRRGI